eukprot:7376844-Prymnesium_polylepis.1
MARKSRKHPLDSSAPHTFRSAHTAKKRPSVGSPPPHRLHAPGPGDIVKKVAAASRSGNAS